MMLLQADQAGPLWLAFESLMEALGFWGRLAVLAGFVLAVIAVIALFALMIQRKS